jgi:hypothetical protein
MMIISAAFFSILLAFLFAFQIKSFPVIARHHR